MEVSTPAVLGQRQCDPEDQSSQHQNHDQRSIGGRKGGDGDERCGDVDHARERWAVGWRRARLDRSKALRPAVCGS